MGINNVFPANIINGNDPILEKKLLKLKGEGQYFLFKTLPGFVFYGKRKTMWLEEGKRANSSPLAQLYPGGQSQPRGSVLCSKSLNWW